jgi:hypothetical protein
MWGIGHSRRWVRGWVGEAKRNNSSMYNTVCTIQYVQRIGYEMSLITCMTVERKRYKKFATHSLKILKMHE